MKTFILTIGLLISSSVFAKSEKIVSSNIKDVTVYLQGAQVHRSGKTNLPIGVSKVVLPGVSPYINPNSIQASGNGDFIVLDVKHDVHYPDPINTQKLPDKTLKQIEQIKDSISLINFDINYSSSTISGLEMEKRLISQNKIITGNNASDSLELLIGAMAYFREKIRDINRQLYLEQKKLANQQNTLSKLEHRKTDLQNFHQNNPDKPKGPDHRVIITVQAKSATRAIFDIRYLVSQAGWSPSYDIRANNLEKPLDFTYKAKVYQNTGEDWENVNMTFSSNNPNRGITKPKLPVWYLNYYQQRPHSYRNTTRGGLNAPAMAKSETTIANTIDMEDDSEEFLKLDKANSSAYYSAMVETKSNFEFKLDIPFSIASDNETHTVAIHEEQLDADFMHYMVPKLEREAFVIAQITGWETLNLLPAEANIFFEGTYVGQTMINPDVITDTLEMSLGRDRGLIAIRKKNKEKEKTNFIGTHKEKTITYEISIRNNRNISISNLVIEDHIPVTGNEDIEIELIDKGKARFDKKTGSLKWELKIKPGETEKIDFTYSVTSSKDKLLTNL